MTTIEILIQAGLSPELARMVVALSTMGETLAQIHEQNHQQPAEPVAEPEGGETP